MMHETTYTRTSQRARRRHESGFSLAEALLVVGILTALGGLVFLGVLRWQRSLRQLEMDATAKELYMAAQNHLTYAESQGLLKEVAVDADGIPQYDEDGSRKYAYDRGGTVESAEGATATMRYFIHGADPLTDSPNDQQSVLGLMLPFGSIDDTVRLSGSYLIRYEPDTATVIDVLYTSDDKDAKLMTPDNYDALAALCGEDNESARRSLKIDDRTIAVGYYGATGGIETLDLMAPTIAIDNGDTLKVTVTDPLSKKKVKAGESYRTVNDELTAGHNLKLRFRVTVEGVHGGSAWFDITDLLELPATEGSAKPAGKQYSFTLDDITTVAGFTYQDSGRVFSLPTVPSGSFATMTAQAEAHGSTPITPGDDIRVTAWVSCDWSSASQTGTVPAGAARSSTAVTNSLFGKASQAEDQSWSVEVSSYRHLANLDERVSGFNPSHYAVSAQQTADLSWKDFLATFATTDAGNTAGEQTVMYGRDASGARLQTEPATFFPVSPAYELAYDGGAFAIAGVVVEATGPAGVFAELPDNSEVRNLELVNAHVTSHGSEATAGALVGKATGKVTIENVLARTTQKANSIQSRTITTDESGVAGGLVGTLAGGASVGKRAHLDGCAASVYVASPGGIAGGLVGMASNADIARSYSGGHTTSGSYDPDKPDVSAKAQNGSNGTAAGGLVGRASATTIDDCYSTCSVGFGASAGGLVGDATGATISDSYVTGLMTGQKAEGAFVGATGAFVGSADSATDLSSNNHYYQIVNYDASKKSELQPVGNKADDTSVVPLDQDWSEDHGLAVFQDFFTPDSDASATIPSWAIPYDATLLVSYPDSTRTASVAHYPLKTIEALGGTAVVDATGTLDEGARRTLVRHLKTHYGDWPMVETLVVNVPSPTP